MFEPPFKTGDEVRLKTGTSKIIVLEVDYHLERPPYYAKHRWGSSERRYIPTPGWYIRFTYQSSTHYTKHDRKWREAEDFQFYRNQPEEELIMTKPTLYQTKEDPVRYGTFLTKNSLGQMVLEMKGENGACVGFTEDAIEIVTPHTVELTMLGMDPSGPKSKSIHVISKKGQVVKGDVMLEINSGVIWRVTTIDSKCLSPRENKSKWMKIPATFVTFGEQ